MCAFFLAFSIYTPQAYAGNGTSGDPFTSLSEAYSVSSSGRYYFNLGSGLFQADVDNSEGGGWVLVLQYVHQGGTNPALSITGAGADLPVTSAAALGTDESGDLTRWGHAGNSAMAQFTGDIELRWYGESSQHARIIHFRSTVGDDYVRTGTGSFDGIDVGFTALTGHTANLPGTAVSHYIDKTDYALTQFPFWQAGTDHWGIRGDDSDGSGASGASGDRWEADGGSGSSSAFDTIHRVWVRDVDTNYTVTTTADSGAGSLRAAIEAANASPTLDNITFAIPNTGPHTIVLATALPTLTDSGVTIDGSSQSGAICNNLWAGTPHDIEIVLDGTNRSFRGLQVSGDNIEIRGVSTVRFSNGINVINTSSNVSVSCSYIGLLPDGSAAANSGGLVLNGTNVLAGGPNPDDGNVISGNSVAGIYGGSGVQNFMAEGNFVGTSPDGLTAVPNGTSGILDFGGTGSTWGYVRKNLISGNNGAGINLTGGSGIVGASGDVIIAGNYIGTNRLGAAAIPNGGDGILAPNGSISGLTIGGTSAADRNIISGNTNSAIDIRSVNDISILGNYIGTDVTGLNGVGNGGVTNQPSLYLISVTDVNIGNGTAPGRNIISDGTGRAIQSSGTATNLTINDNYIGTDINGNTGLANGTMSSSAAADVIIIEDITNLDILNNVIGPYGGEGIEFWGASVGDDIVIQGNSFGLGVDGTTPFVSGRTTHGHILFGNGYAATNVIIGGTGFLQGNILANGLNLGVSIDTNGGFTGAIIGNQIKNNAADGVAIKDAANVAIYQNSIYNNGGLAIDLNDDGVTDNDVGGADADTGPNDLLNFPVINTITAGGTTSVGYSVELDVPANTEGYRIEFFKNSSPDTTNGEGEIFLGFIDTGDHTGGAISYDGTFTSNVAVSVGDSISATTTRKTATGFDITSEFAVNVLAASSLIVTNTNDSGSGSLRAAIEYANANTAADNITFQIPNAGPHTISLTSALPTIADAGIVIDGTTQANTVCNDLWTGAGHDLQIVLDGTSAGTSSVGIRFNAADQTVKGLSIVNFGGSAVYSTGDNSTVECNYVGVQPDGTTGGSNGTDLINGGTVRFLNSGAAVTSNLVSGNSSSNHHSIWVNSSAIIQGNFIGVTADGMTALGNADSGLYLNAASNVSIGGGVSGQGNLISGSNKDQGIEIRNSSNAVTISGNYIGTNRTGTQAILNDSMGIQIAGSSNNVTIGGTNSTERNIISGNGADGINLNSVSNITILGNYIGLGEDGTTDIGNVGSGIETSGATSVTIGDGTSTGRNVISSNNVIGIDLRDGSSATISDNYVGVAADGTTVRGNRSSTIAVQSNSTALITKNIIAYSETNDGIEVQGSLPMAAIIENSIFGNFEQAIEIDDDGTAGEGVNANDMGDADTGPNDLLNFPLINAITASGTTSVGYSVELDVPANTEGYRIEFFKNSSPDATNGEGETFLGFVDTGDHTGGAISYDGTFTASEAVAVGDSISATTTRKTATSFDITSEFAVNVTATNPLVVTNTNDSGAGSLRAAIDYAESNAGPDVISFEIPNAGPHVITLASNLPTIDSTGVTIDGLSQSGAVCGNVWAGQGHTLQVEIDASAVGTALRIDGNDAVIRGLSITGASSNAINSGLASANATLQCNYIGLRPDGTADGNAEGLRLNGTGYLIGGPGATDGNVISGNTSNNIFFPQTSNNNHTVQGNFIGPFPDGLTAPTQGVGITNFHVDNLLVDNNLISGNGSFGYASGPGTSPVTNTFTNNYFGTTRTGNALLTNGSDDIHYNTSSPSVADGLTIGTPGNGNVFAGTSGRAIIVVNASNLTIQDNKIGIGADGVTDLSIAGVGIQLGSGATGARVGGDGLNEGNVIANTGSAGIRVETTDVTILGNTIYNATGGEEITVNDHANDIDAPTLTSVIVDGTNPASVTLSANVAAGSYRVEMFRVGTDTGGQGDLQEFVGTFTLTHGGTGAETLQGSFTPTVSLSTGEVFTATLTEATSGIAPYGETSEAAFNVTAVSPLIVTNTNDSGAGSLRAAIEYANANTAADNIIFQIPNAGPHTIAIASNLPNITDAGISIDAITQSGAICGQLTTGTPHDLRVYLDGQNSSFIGFRVQASDVTIRGFAIGRYQSRSIILSPGHDNLLVECNYLGTEVDGVTAAPVSRSNATSGILIGGGSGHIFRNNLISGNNHDSTDDGMALGGVTGATVQGNIIGLDETGSVALGNGDVGLSIGSSSSNITVGGTTAATRNVIAGNGGDGIAIEGGTGITILGNYIGINAAGTAALGNGALGIEIDGIDNFTIGDGTVGGRNVISGNASQGIHVLGTSTGTIEGNYIGTDITGNAALPNIDDGIYTIDTVVTTIRDNVISGNGIVTAFPFPQGIVIGGSSTSTILGNKIGVGADGTTALPNMFGGLAVDSNGSAAIGDGTAGGANIIANNIGRGIRINSTRDTYAIGNSIYNTVGNVGIDLDVDGSAGDGVNDNDVGDADTGPNDLLNFPLINTITAGGTTSVGYSVELDVPANTEGYRIEFFKNSSPDTTNGEGEIFLGFVDTGDHTGGAISYDGTFTASQIVSVGDSISATTTRKTATGYDITSEFAVNVLTVSPLVVTNTNDSGAGSLRAAIEYANANAAADNITFQIPNTGPHVISLSTSLPTITDDGVSIDGSTQSGALCRNLWAGTPHTLQIEIDGQDASSGIDGFEIAANNVTLKGLSILRFRFGVTTTSAAQNFALQCNYVGLRTDGTTILANIDAIRPGGTNDLIGGLTAGQGNVISGNNAGIISQTNVAGLMIRGNFIGTDETGMLSRGNPIRAVNHQIGAGTWSDVTKNLISGNSGIDNVTGAIALEPDDSVIGSSGDLVIAGNYIGVNRVGTASLINGGPGIKFYPGSTSNVTIGGANLADRNVISGNTTNGIELNSVDSVDVFGNYVGLNAAGTSDIANGGHGIVIANASNINIGNGTLAGGNVISGNTDRGIFSSSSTNMTIAANYIGLSADGVSPVANDAGIVIAASAASAGHQNLEISGNWISANSGAGLSVTSSNFGGVGATSTITVKDNNIGVTSDKSTARGNGGRGVYITNVPGVTIGGTGASDGNIIANNGNDGISVSSLTPDTVMLGNSIYNNAQEGIDLGGSGGDGVTDNDIGDSDAGANDLLNFPVITSFGPGASGTEVAYAFTLDVPANSSGYRVEFFKNSSPDSSGHGEGQTYLGFVDTNNHPGGSQSFSGTFLATEPIAQNDHISATATRKTGLTSFSATSEFSLSYTSNAATELTAAKSVDVYDPTSAGLYALPGNDIISSLTVTNPGNAPADADSIVIIDAIPAEMTFYNGDIDDGGPQSHAISFVQTGGANLTFTNLSDVKYSNSGIRPTDMNGCTYTPSAGYDANVTFICLNPKGAMAAGNPDPTFTVAYRARIK